MRRKGLWLSVLATAMIAGNVSAAVINYSANGWNFFTYDTSLYGTQVNNETISANTAAGRADGVWDYRQVQLSGTTQMSNLHFQQEGPDNAINDIPSGQLADQFYTRDEVGAPNPGNALLSDNRYDVEQVFWAFDVSTNDLHIGIVTGFNSAGIASNGHYAGDLFLGFGANNPITIPNNGYDLAIGTSVGGGVDQWGASNNRQGNVWQNGGSWTTSSASPFATESDPFRYSGGGTPNSALDVDVDWIEGSDWTGDAAGNDHNLLAVRINLTGTTWLDNFVGDPTLPGGFSFHWTMGCGNDTAHLNVQTVPTNDNVVPVPAAAPMGLLGMGLLALVRRVRRRTEC